MFTGLIETMGTVRRVSPRGNYVALTVEPDIPFDNVVEGESIAVSGPCLTVVSFDASSFTVEASQETIRLTTVGNMRSGKRVNLERALRADARLGGHFVSGHIDDTMPVTKIKRVGESLQITVGLTEKHVPYVIDKGSVAVDGISLTVIDVDRNGFTVNLIPETQQRTTWGSLKVGDEINVEFDMIGKYILNFISGQDKRSPVTIDFMRKMGF